MFVNKKNYKLEISIFISLNISTYVYGKVCKTGAGYDNILHWENIRNANHTLYIHLVSPNDTLQNRGTLHFVFNYSKCTPLRLAIGYIRIYNFFTG